MNTRFEIPDDIRKVALAAAAMAASTTCAPTSANANGSNTLSDFGTANAKYSAPYNYVSEDERNKTSSKSTSNGKPLIGTSNTVAKDVVYVNQYKAERGNNLSYDVYMSGVDLPVYYYNNLAEYWSDVEVELTNHADKFKTNPAIIRNQAFYTASRIAELKSDKALFELTPAQNLKFTLSFSDDRTLMVNKPFNNVEGLPSNDIIFSFFIGNELVSADTNDFDDFIDGFKKYLAS